MTKEEDEIVFYLIKDFKRILKKGIFMDRDC